MANAGDWDSLDTGETYYGYSWDFARNYSRALVMFKSAPGSGSDELVPDLASDLGKASDGGKTWTYTIRKGLKFDDGTPITSKDVAYGVERSTDKVTFPNGPAYFDAMLDWPSGWKGPYKSKGMDVSSAIETPDDSTIVFHLKRRSPGSTTSPSPRRRPPCRRRRTRARSTRTATSRAAPTSSRTCSRASPSSWSATTSGTRAPTRTARRCLTSSTSRSNVNADDIDNRIMSGDLDLDVAGTGAQPAALAGCSTTRPSRRTPTTRRSRGSGTPRSTRR